MPALSANHQTFHDEYIAQEPPRDPAIAYLNTYKCKESSARASGYALLKHPVMSRAIARSLSSASNKAALSAERILTEERRLSTSTLADVVNKDGDIIPLHLLAEDIQRALSGVDITDTIKSVKDQDGTTETLLERKYKYRLWDKGKSIERGERHLGMFEKDNQQHLQAPVININYAGREGAEHQRIYELVMDNLYLLPDDFQKLIAPAVPQDKNPTLPEPIPPTEQLPQDVV